MATSNSRPRSDAPTVVFHWLLVFALIISLGTGLRIAGDAEDATLTRMLNPILMQGDVSHLHVLSATLLSFLAVAYVLYLWRARLAARVALSPRSLGALDRTTRWRAVNRALYWVAFALLVAAGITGALLYFAPTLLPSGSVSAVHLFTAWAIISYAVFHMAAQLALGGLRQLLKIVSPRAAYGTAAAVAAGVSMLAVGAVVYPSSEAVIRPLVIARTQTAPVLDGNPDDAVWAQAKPVEIHTVRGKNFPGGETTVRVRGVHDDTNAYLLFEWQDPTRSQKHVPLVKTAEGWKVLESRYGINDENDYYEDKFAVMLARTPKIGGGATQMGPKPLDDKPGPTNTRGLHYTTDGSYVDLWHWKSVRTGPLGQLDDDYFGPPMAVPTKPGERYTGGYTTDPKTGGGFEQNWNKIEGSHYVQPKRLPKDLAVLQARMGHVSLDPNVGDDGQWWMALSDTVPYSKELDTYPVGTVIPSVLIDKPFEGDRGDVAGVGTWNNGWWRPEVKRKLDTGSKFDVPIANGTYLWVSVFDHNQTRHSRHLHPVRIEIN